MRPRILKLTGLTDSLLLLVLTSLLIAPLFRLEYLDNWPSIESTFIADARMLSQNLPHPGWQPLWYCGTRTDYIYPPALRYGTALVSKFGHVSPARAYHLYTAFFYVLGIVGVYWMVRIGAASRYAGLLAAGATALLSPSFLLLTQIRHDSGFWVPQRLHVLMAYGEGPHITALCILPLALAATFLALRQWRPGALAAAGVFCALAVANNFYGATALALLYPIMVWSVWIGERTWGIWLRAAAIPLLAYGLSAFWLTPSYVRITLIDLKWVAQRGNPRAIIAPLLVVGLYCLLSWRFGNRRPERAWSTFVAGSAIVLGVNVLGFYYFGWRIAGEPARLVPELDLVLIVAFVEVMRILWKRPRWRVAVALVTVVAFLPALRYFNHVWSPFPRAAPLESVYEYQTIRWVHENLPGARVLSSGTIRFWYDAWFDNPQLDGGSMQGMLNQIIPSATWQIFRETRADLAVLWLQALGTDAVIVPDKTSFEHYHDYQAPAKFRGAVPVLHDDHHGTVIYRIPRVYPGLARIVDAARIGEIGEIHGGDDLAGLTKYVSVVENPAKPAAVATWRGFDELEIEARTQSGEDVLLQETWDPAWRAWENGKQLTIRAEPLMGFMLIGVPEGNHAIRMRFDVPLENRVGQAILALSLMAVSGLVIGGCTRRLTTAPAPTDRDMQSQV